MLCNREAKKGLPDEALREAEKGLPDEALREAERACQTKP